MPEPALVLWILGFPFVLGIFELVRTFAAIKHGREHGTTLRTSGPLR